LTSFSSGIAGSPKWSPDGQFIVFDARPEDNADIYTVPSGGGPVKQLTTNPGEDHVPFWSRDNWIYFASSRAGASQIFRMRPDGSALQQVTHDGGIYAEVSRDGKWLYYAVGGKGLWRMPPEGGEPTRVLAPASLYTNLTWVSGANGIYAIGAHTPEGFPAVFYPFEGGSPRTIATPSTFPVNFPAISPDGRWFLYTNADEPVFEIMLVENFR
jgi:Tol biopolymer transport system component